MAEFVLEVATLRHVHLLAPRMRKADREEVWASGHLRPAQSLRRSLLASEWARTVFVKGEPVAMCGVVVKEIYAYPWLLTTDLVEKYPLTFWRASKFILAEIRKLYPILLQAVDARYTQAVSFVARLGFTVRDAVPFGKEGLPFHPVVLAEGG